MGLNSLPLNNHNRSKSASTSNINGTSSLKSFQRSFSSASAFPLSIKSVNVPKFDQDDDELTGSQWPASPPLAVKSSLGALGNTKGTNNAAASRAHWGKKTLVNLAATSYPEIATSLNSTVVPVKTTLSTQNAVKKPIKRQYPWETMADPPTKKVKGPQHGAFHTMSTGASSLGNNAVPGPSKSDLLTGSSLNIKQKVLLSPEQQKILHMVTNENKNVFFTGSAGTGKSVLLREIIANLKIKHRSRPDAVCVTASTGMAACNIGGTTIHSFAGIGLGKESVSELCAKIRKNRKAASRWQRAHCLVIDEVSMVDGDLFDKLAGIACAMRKKPDKPFGGLQLVVTGDFFQLPPVSSSKFAFEAKEWSNCVDHTVNLTQVFRQKDTEFIDMLNEMRFGQLSTKSIARFRSLAREPSYPNDGISPTELFAMRNQVEQSNTGRLNALQGEVQTYLAEDTGQETGPALEKLFDNMMAPKKLVLKVGCQVMLIKNKDEQLVNGSTGKVVAFRAPGADMEPDDSDTEYNMSEFNTGGHEFDIKPKVKTEALDIKGIVNLKKTTLKSTEVVPWIEWQLPDGRKLAPEPIAREEFKIEQGEIVKAKRKQFPIILAWAVSIHKSQGQTLSRVKVDLGKVFEAGQSYVALSRATSLDALQVLNFDPSKVRCHPKVVAWSKSLETVS